MCMCVRGGVRNDNQLFGSPFSFCVQQETKQRTLNSSLLPQSTGHGAFVRLRVRVALISRVMLAAHRCRCVAVALHKQGYIMPAAKRNLLANERASRPDDGRRPTFAERRVLMSIRQMVHTQHNGTVSVVTYRALRDDDCALGARGYRFGICFGRITICGDGGRIGDV